MKMFMFFAVLFALFILVIVIAYKPSMIENEYNRIREPITQHFAEKNAEAWRLAKETEWNAWSKKIKIPADCAKSVSAIRQLECKNQWQLQADTFERIWNEKVSERWKPDGVD
jgi:hypothetical protein